MELLIYFALPLATILLAIVFEKVFHSPFLVTIFIFAVYLIVIFSLYAFGVITNLGEALIALTVYTLISFIVAYISRLFRCFRNNIMNMNSVMSVNNMEGSSTSLTQNNTNILNDENNLIYNCDNSTNSSANLCFNKDGETSNNRISVTGRIVPNQINQGRTGFLRGCYRRY